MLCDQERIQPSISLWAVAPAHDLDRLADQNR
jgi:hypothetical protein